MIGRGFNRKLISSKYGVSTVMVKSKLYEYS